MGKNTTTESFIDWGIKNFGNLYDYSETNYTDNNIPVTVICKIHGRFLTTKASHLYNKRGCPYCSGAKTHIIDFVERANIIHNNKYNYTKVIWLGLGKKIEIVCPIHGSFFQNPYNHLLKQGCRKCAKNPLRNLEYVIDQGTKIHNNKYDYSKSIFINMSEKIEIICPVHGSFWQTPSCHIDSQKGCLICGNEGRRLTLEEFIQRAQQCHGVKYDYSKSIYIINKEKVEIICHKHGNFFQSPLHHLNGAGCPKCTTNISKIQEQCLDFFKVPLEYRNVTLKKNSRFWKVDAYDPKTNTVYEFYGDYWHGNPKVFDPSRTNETAKQNFYDLYRKTLLREHDLKIAGYKLIIIWERDFKNIQKVFSSLKELNKLSQSKSPKLGEDEIVHLIKILTILKGMDSIDLIKYTLDSIIDNLQDYLSEEVIRKINTEINNDVNEEYIDDTEDDEDWD